MELGECRRMRISDIRDAEPAPDYCPVPTPKCVTGSSILLAKSRFSQNSKDPEKVSGSRTTSRNNRDASNLAQHDRVNEDN